LRSAAIMCPVLALLSLLAGYFYDRMWSGGNITGQGGSTGPTLSINGHDGDNYEVRLTDSQQVKSPDGTITRGRQEELDATAAAAGGGGGGGGDGGGGAPAAASLCIVIGRVVTAGTLLRDAGADVESDVLCVISTGGADEQMAKVTTAKLRVELNKKIADHVKDGSSNVTVGGLTNSMTTLVVGKNSATNKQQTIAGAAAGAAGADSIAFQKVDGLEDGTVTVLCSHSSTKMLQVAGEGNVNVNVNASGTLSPSAMFVVVSSVEGDGDGGGPQGVRLQHAEDDACWLRVGKDGAVDAEGDPDAEETLFVVTTHADGSLSLKSVAAGKVLAVGKDGVVAAAEGADDVAGSTKFTAYQRLLAA